MERQRFARPAPQTWTRHGRRRIVSHCSSMWRKSLIDPERANTCRGDIRRLYVRDTLRQSQSDRIARRPARRKWRVVGFYCELCGNTYVYHHEEPPGYGENG